VTTQHNTTQHNTQSHTGPIADLKKKKGIMILNTACSSFQIIL